MSINRKGVTLIELIVVVAVAGILLGIGAVQFNYGGSATSQAARVVSSALNQARFEAIRINANAWLRVQAANGGTVVICGTELGSTGPVCGAEARDVQVIRFAGSDLGRAQIASPADVSVTFDRRGVMRPPAQIDIVITDRSGGNTRTVRIAATGRAEIQ